jgi:serine/threonine protein kinase
MAADPRRVKELFAAALELSDLAARQALLDRECVGDEELRRRVAALLHAHAQPQPALDQPLAAVGPVAPELTGPYNDAPVTSAEQAGTVLAGKYKLLEKIGEGGMGSVWMVQQQEPVKRTVAVKLIRRGDDSRAVLTRFEAERQALALMDHPSIAKVLDAGTTERGAPFFVMELVKGVPITKFCDERRLTPKQRLELFIPVCQAIQHAHQKGIIHRDIKPSNVLVALYDDRPVPKVIDFGLAKATGPQLTEQTMVTGFGALVGTPQYMSPEQATLNNLDIDTRSDIFSLGVLLYELLAGSPPLGRKELEKAGMLEILRAIREEEPPRPSVKLSSDHALPSLAANRGTEPARLTRLLRGEIDWIVMKALEKERMRRYETANGFALDIQRYLADEPVQAGPPSAVYRLRKFVKRNKGAVLAAGLVLLALLVGIVGTTLGLLQAEAARQDAETAQAAEATRAEGERRARLDAQRAAAAARAAKVTADAAAVAERQAAATASKAARAEKRANEQAQKRLRQIENGIQILTSVFHDLDPNSAATEGVSLRVLLGRRLGEAVQQLQGDAVGDKEVVARLQNWLGAALVGLGELAQAEVVLTKARQTFAESLGAEHLDTLGTMHNLAEAYRLQGKHAQAEALCRQVLAGRVARLGAEHLLTLDTKNNLAMLYLDQRKLAQAEPLCRQVLAGYLAQLGPEHARTLTAKNNLALLYTNQKKAAPAEKLFKEVLAVYRAQLGDDHFFTIRIKNNLAVLYSAQGKVAEAVALQEEVLEAGTATLGPNHPTMLLTKFNLATHYAETRKWDRSIRLFEEVVAQWKKTRGATDANTVKALASLGAACRDAGRLDEGIRHLEEAWAAAQRPPEPLPTELAGIPANLALAHDQARQFARSEPLYRALLRQSERQFGNDDLRTALFKGKLGLNLLSQKKHAEAEPLLREYLALCEAKLPVRWELFRLRWLLGAALLGQKKYAEAEPLLKDGYRGLKQHQAQMPAAMRQRRLVEALERLVELYEATGNADEAARWRKEVEAVKGASKQP